MANEKAMPACRISVLLARDAARGVVLRRGPTDWVQQILWHTDSDTFEPGQWFHGRIYEGMSDLSPNGELFLYVARKPETPEQKHSAYTHKWTAISRAPYFTALALWPIGDSWDGGGYFMDNDKVWLCHASAHAHPDHRPRGLRVLNTDDRQRFAERSVRDGWERTQEGRFSFERSSAKDGLSVLGARGTTEQPAIWQKRQPGGRYRLVTELYREPDFDTAALSYITDADDMSRSQTLVEGTTWIDWDRRGRLVFACEGQLYATEAPFDPEATRLLADFNANTREQVEAPAWARRW
jgi:hypothetical protein